LEPPDWAARLKSLRALLPGLAVTDRVSRQQSHVWRSTAVALDAFDAALEETAAGLGAAGRVTLAQFWRQAEVALSLDPLRVADRRRNVVHVMDVYEGRQWELPVAFVCGLTERHFPQYHREDPLLDDAARSRAGLRTSADRQSEERFLFEFAMTRSTGEVALSYARFNEKGEPTLPSFFLDDIEAVPCETRVRPKPLREVSAPPPAAIHDDSLRERLAGTHKTLSPTSIESFLQCPFQFFAAKTLRLRQRPPAPRDRMDLLRQGGILHEALAELARLPLLGVAVFDRVFAEEAHRARIPPTYRTEAVRLELLRHFEAFVADRQMALDWESRAEEKFSFALNPLLSIRGRIDRIDIGPNNQALVIDYKYSAAGRIRDRIEENTSGNLVQGGLYLLAAHREFGLEPAGMLFCGLRKNVVWDGWHLPIAGLERIGESLNAQLLREFMDRAAGKAVDTFESIVSGRIAADPADTDKCEWCAFRDICRVETPAAARRAGSG
jgi:ATP-dependent helicase/DNAse subunit B